MENYGDIQGWGAAVEEEDDDDGDEIGLVEGERNKRVVIGGRSGSGSGRRSSLSVAHCQADGCNADLSSAGAYHRRHKVCEIHAKAAVVILAGLDQRFCQQCSRFHWVSEFDEAKRSCRRRLAGHNERRRKNLPEFHGQSST